MRQEPADGRIGRGAPHQGEQSERVDVIEAADELGLEKILLHELAHAWLATNENAASREAFMALVDSPTWDDSSTPHDEQGVERAANTLAWGLSSLSMESVGWTAPCELLAEAFHVLTGAAPLAACR